MVKRWAIYANGVLICHEYQSLEKARDYAFRYESGCWNQEEPFFPEMSIVEEVLPDDE